MAADARDGAYDAGDGREGGAPMVAAAATVTGRVTSWPLPNPPVVAEGDAAAAETNLPNISSTVPRSLDSSESMSGFGIVVRVRTD